MSIDDKTNQAYSPNEVSLACRYYPTTRYSRSGHRTALDDAIDRITLDRSEYERNTSSENAERRREERVKMGAFVRGERRMY